MSCKFYLINIQALNVFKKNRKVKCFMWKQCQRTIHEINLWGVFSLGNCEFVQKVISHMCQIFFVLPMFPCLEMKQNGTLDSQPHNISSKQFHLSSYNWPFLTSICCICSWEQSVIRCSKQPCRKSFYSLISWQDEHCMGDNTVSHWHTIIAHHFPRILLFIIND